MATGYYRKARGAQFTTGPGRTTMRGSRSFTGGPGRPSMRGPNPGEVRSLRGGTSRGIRSLPTPDVQAFLSRSPGVMGGPAFEVGIASSSVANPSVITTSTPHGLDTGDQIVIANHAGSTPSING